MAKSDGSFIRNGQAYGGAQASEHLRSKYKYLKDQIKTPEDFIRLAATQSAVTGKPYLIKTKDGREIRCDAWLTAMLAEYRRRVPEAGLRGRPL